MHTNVGTIDRIARVIVGLLLIAYAIPIGFRSTGWNWIGWIGVIRSLPALLGFAPGAILSQCVPLLETQSHVFILQAEDEPSNITLVDILPNTRSEFLHALDVGHA
jgi:hypothetical protein